MQRHLDRLVAVLVVHVVDDVERVDIRLRQPVHHPFVAVDDLVIVQILASDGRELRADLLARHLVASAVQGVEQTLHRVHAGAEELHLLAEPHRRHAAGDRAVVAPFGRIRSSLSYWTALVSMLTLAAKRLKAAGNRVDQKMVMFGSGAGPSV